MDKDPLDIALRNVVETRNLLGTLILSSESFDYHAAKAALGDLQRKIRDLGRAQAHLERLRRARRGKICVVDFGEASPEDTHQKI